MLVKKFLVMLYNRKDIQMKEEKSWGEKDKQTT